MVNPRRRNPSTSQFIGRHKQQRNLALIRIAAIWFATLFIVTSIILYATLSEHNANDDDNYDDHNAEVVGKREPHAKVAGPTPHTRMDGDVNLDDTYAGIRAAHDKRFPPDDAKRLRAFAQSLRTHDYQLTEGTGSMPYDVNNCPPTPPEGYPQSWSTLDILNNWNPNDTADPHSHTVYQGICRFDAEADYDKANAYREAEVPFVIRDDPVVLPTVERWNQPEYLPNILGHQRQYRTDMSSTNQLMFYRTGNNGVKKSILQDWEEPTKEVLMSYPDWLDKANNPDAGELEPNKPHWYFRLNAKSQVRDHYLFEELFFFKPKRNFYMVDPSDTRGINCRFGMRGNTAENHFDASRNFIALFGGERRYLLSHPSQCKNLALYPMGHPSARHSEVDWSNPDLEQFPQFRQAKSHEVVLQAGDVLYLPTNYFHHIISLDTNFQCNARSGVTQESMGLIHDCGFAAVAPQPIRKTLLGKKR